MDEFALIDRFFARQRIHRPDVRLGIGDDAAVVALAENFELVIATDTICCGTHFPEATLPDALGHRCLAVNLSDLAAMGAEPLWSSLALSLPSADPDWLEAFAAGFFNLAERFNVGLVGGDTVKGPLAMTVTLHGRVSRGEYITRNGAGPDERIYVTGHPGDAGAACRFLSGSDANMAKPPESLMKRFLFPEPRVNEGMSLGGIATAMIDISDGLHDDLAKILDASGIGADLEAAKLPLSTGLQACVETEQALELALTGGDDYELCFTVPDERAAAFDKLCAGWGCPVTLIGRTDSEPGIRWERDGRPYRVPDRSFRHF